MRNKKGEQPPSPMYLDEMMTVIDIKAGIAFITGFILLCSIGIWVFFGKIQLREEVEGILVKSGKIINIYATDDCTLLDFTLKPESLVEKEQVVARIGQPELVQEINRMLDEGASEAEIKEKQEELIQRSQIITPEAGRVVDVYVHRGDYVEKGSKIASISKEASNEKAMLCLFYVSVEKMKNIRKGLRVNVLPANVNKEIHGNMTGIISNISEYPVTRQYLADVLGSEVLAEEFLKDSARYEVYINLITSEETVTGYEWTTSAGPNKKFGKLTLCDGSVITGELRPIEAVSLIFENVES